MEKKKRTFQKERWYERVIKIWCVSVRLSLTPCSSLLHTYALPFPNSHLPFSIFQLCDLSSSPKAKSYRLTQLKMCPKPSLSPSLQIQYFTLLAGILVHLVKLRGEDMWQPITLWLCRVQLWVI